MSVIFLLLTVSTLVAAMFLAGFIWAVRKGQYEDDRSPAVRILLDDGVREAGKEEIGPKANGDRPKVTGDGPRVKGDWSLVNGAGASISPITHHQSPTTDDHSPATTAAIPHSAQPVAP